MNPFVVLPVAVARRELRRKELHFGLGLLFLFQGVGPMLLALHTLAAPFLAEFMGPSEIALAPGVGAAFTNQQCTELLAFGLVLALVKLSRTLGPEFLLLATAYLWVGIAQMLHHWMPLTFEQRLGIQMGVRAMLAAGLMVLAWSAQKWGLREVSISALMAMICGMAGTLAEMLATRYPHPGVLAAGGLSLAQILLMGWALFRLWRSLPEAVVPREG